MSIYQTRKRLISKFGEFLTLLDGKNVADRGEYLNTEVEAADKKFISHLRSTESDFTDQCQIIECPRFKQETFIVLPSTVKES